MIMRLVTSKASFNSINRHFSLLRGFVDSKSSEFKSATDKMQPLLEKYDGILKSFEEGGGARAVAAHTVRNKKVLARDRLAKVMDKSEFTELFRFAGYEQPYGTIPAAGSVSAIGRVSDRLCFVIANDATVKGGTIYPITLKKQLRNQELCGECRLPMIYLIDSGGAFLPLQSDIFPDKNHGGRSFYTQAVLEAAGIPQLSMVCGSCTAGGAYIPTMSEECTIVQRIGHIFLGGPPLVQAALGEVISAEELGGAKLHSSVSGCSDHFAATEDAGFRQIRHMVSSLPDQEEYFVNKQIPCEPLFSDHELEGLAPNFYESPDKDLIYQILARVLDGSNFFEFKSNFGCNLVTGFGRLNGRLIGVASCYDNLTLEDALKGSQFVQICQQRSAPMLFVVHTVEDEVGVEYTVESALKLRAKSNFMASVATFPLPKVTLVVGDAIGYDSVMMAGRSMSPRLLIAWPNARVGLTSEGATDAFSAAGKLFFDDVIKPRETRSWLSLALQMSYIQTYGNRETQASPKSILRF